MSNFYETKNNSIYPDSDSMPHQPQPEQPEKVILGPPIYTVMPVPPPFKQHPLGLVCPKCNETIQTRIEYTNGLLTWLLCGVCIIFGLILGCCLIPFCIDGCKDAEHYCPKCNSYLGKYKRIS